MLSNFFNYSFYEHFEVIDNATKQRLATIGITDTSNIPVLNSTPITWDTLSNKLSGLSIPTFEDKITFLTTYKNQYQLNVNEYVVFADILETFGVNNTTITQFTNTLTNTGVQGRAFFDYMKAIIYFGVRYNTTGQFGSLTDFLTACSKFGWEYKANPSKFLSNIGKLYDVNLNHTYVPELSGKTKFTSFVNNMVDVLYMTGADFDDKILPVLTIFYSMDTIVIPQKKVEPVKIRFATSGQLDLIKTDLKDFYLQMGTYTHEIVGQQGTPLFNSQNPRNFMIGLSMFNSKTNDMYNTIDLRAVVPFLKQEEYRLFQLGNQQPMITNKVGFINSIASAIMNFMKTNYLKIGNVSIPAFNYYLITYNILKLFPHFSYQFIALNLYNSNVFDDYNDPANQYFQGNTREGFTSNKPVDLLAYRPDSGFQGFTMNKYSNY